jgi:AAA15 family ATPase/GTPase
MIRKIKFNNFYSFETEQVLDFTANKKVSYSYRKSKTGDQVSRIISFIGPNASGKTNVARLLSFIGYFISNKDNSKTDLTTAFKSFFNNTKVSNISIEFELKNILFFYDFSIKKNHIIGESLRLRVLKKFAREETVYVREENKFSILNTKFINIEKKNLVDINPSVSSVAFFSSLFDIEVIKLIYEYFSKFNTNINERGHIHNKDNRIFLLKLFMQDQDMKDEVNSFINRFDLGLNSFDINEKSELNKKYILASGVHSLDKTNINLSFEYESRGTQLLFFNLIQILCAVKHNSFIVLDELECGLHPEALNKLISYFIDEKADSGVQLFFSSHSLGFMNILDSHQIFLIEKNKECRSQVYRLSQVDNIRSDANYLARYMSGAYGAFPKIRV